MKEFELIKWNCRVVWIHLVLCAVLCGVFAMNTQRADTNAATSKSIGELKAAAEKGDAKAQFEFGKASFEAGKTPEDLAEAIAWIRKAATRGLAEAQSAFGNAYFVGKGVSKDWSKAAEWWRKAAEQGFADAQYNLAVTYHRGRGVPIDMGEAVKWYRKAAENGLPTAQSNLGFMYYHGQGVPKNTQEALKWYRKAAEQGFAPAQMNIGMMYDSGEAQPEEFAEARRKAAELGLASAQFDLGLIYLGGNGATKDESEAIKWLSKAAEQRHAWAMFRLGYVLSQRNATNSSDLADGLKWYCEAAEEGHPEAQGIINVYLAEVGKLYRKKKETPPAWFGETLDLLRKKGEEGQWWAQYNLGMIYINGHALPADYIESYKWFSLAATQEKDSRSAGACKRLEKELTREELAEAKRRAAAVRSNQRSPSQTESKEDTP